jgi:hypothetical protein
MLKIDLKLYSKSDDVEDRFETLFRRNEDPVGVLFKIK